MELEFLTNIQDVIKIGAILIALFHLLAGLVLYYEILRINRVIKTPRRYINLLVINVYILVLIIVLLLIILS